MSARVRHAERNPAICAMYRSGASLREVGDHFNLTPEGARQVLKKCGEPIRDKIQAVKANWQDPEFRARNAAAIKANWQDPEFRARNAAAVKANWQDPEFRARNAAAIKANWQDPEFRARHAAAVKEASARKLSWCPPKLIEDYRLLAHHLGAVEARSIIEAQIAGHHVAPPSPAVLATVAL